MKKSSKRLFSALIGAMCAISTIGAVSVSAISMETPIVNTSRTESVCKSPIYYGTWTDLEKDKYPTYNYWAGGYPDASVTSRTSSTPISEWQINDILGPKYAHYAINCSERDQEGFAFKLAYDFYDTKSFIQVPKSSSYEPRVGDIVFINNETIFLNDEGKNSFDYVKCNKSTKQITWAYSMSKTAVKNNMVYAWRPMIQGDVNGDSLVTMDDVTMLHDYISKRNIDSNTTNPFWKAAADVDGNGVVEITDMTTLSIEITRNLKNNLHYVKRANG